MTIQQSPTIDEEIADLREAIEIVQSNIEEGRYDKAEQEELLRRHQARLNELMMLKTSPDEMEKAFGHVVAIVIVLALIAAFIAGVFTGYKYRGSLDHFEATKLCQARLEDKRILYVWRQEYCGNTNRGASNE